MSKKTTLSKAESKADKTAAEKIATDELWAQYGKLAARRQALALELDRTAQAMQRTMTEIERNKDAK